MKWVRAIINTIKPGFGGIVTFCEDPDDLLDIVEVREAIRAEGMTINDWDGTPQALQSYQELAESDMPILVVPPGSFRHVVDGILSGYAWHNLGIGGLFNKFSYEVIKSIPRQYWEQLRELHHLIQRPQNADETAILVARAIYGADPLHLQIGNGWIKLLLEISKSLDGLPQPIAKSLAHYAPEWLDSGDIISLLVDPSAVRGALAVLKSKKPELLSQIGSSDKTNDIMKTGNSKTIQSQQPKKLCEGINVDDAAESVLEFGSFYCQPSTNSSLDEKLQLKINNDFAIWLEKNYAIMLASHNPKVLRLPNLLEKLDDEIGCDKLLILVVDALGLIPWNIAATQWKDSGLISRSDTHAAFAVLPTVTSLSRRALFEGKLPSQFSIGDHSQKLERSLWKSRYKNDGSYFTSSEKLGISDSFALGKPRVCVVDVKWDKLTHSADPDFHSLQELASSWAAKTELRSIITEAWKSGYRVIITADHGVVSCKGIEQPNIGELTDERSKRVLIFNKIELRDGIAKQTKCHNIFQPTGLSSSCYPLFAQGNDSFDLANVCRYSHGGLSIEEVLVPVSEVFEK
ncbi:MAG: PglZ domain-containing protein [Armatimonadota bacterium]